MVEILMIKIFITVFINFTNLIYDENQVKRRLEAKLTIIIISILLLTRSINQGLQIYNSFYTMNHDKDNEIDDIVSYNNLLGGSIVFFGVYATCVIPTFICLTIYFILYQSGTQHITKTSGNNHY